MSAGSVTTIVSKPSRIERAQRGVERTRGGARIFRQREFGDVAAARAQLRDGRGGGACFREHERRARRVVRGEHARRAHRRGLSGPIGNRRAQRVGEFGCADRAVTQNRRARRR